MTDHAKRLTIAVPYVEESCGFQYDSGGTWENDTGRGVFACRDGAKRLVRSRDIIDAMHRTWPLGHEQADHAKRLAEIGEAVGERLPLSPSDGAFLWEQIRAASEALDAAGAPPGSLAERVRALTSPSYSPPITAIVERHRRAEQALGAGVRGTTSHLDRGVLLSEVARQRRVIDKLVADVEALAAVKQAEIEPIINRFRAAFGADVPAAASGKTVARRLFTCSECGGDVHPCRSALRIHEESPTERYAIPADMEIPTCERCGEVFYSTDLLDEIRRRGRVLPAEMAMPGRVYQSGAAFFEETFGEGREAWSTPEGQRFLREMRGGLDDCGVPPEPDIEPAAGD